MKYLNSLIVSLSIIVSFDVNAFMTSNSLRRDAASELEKNAVVKVGFCTGFFLANDRHKNLVATARHCFDEPVNTWCAETVNDYLIYSADGLNHAVCKSVALNAEDTDDFVILEVSDFSDLSGNAGFKPFPLRIADYFVNSGTPLKVIGFPSNRTETETATVTENCWDNSGVSKFWNDERPTPLTGTNFEWPDYDPFQAKYSTESPGWHNCSVWAGNSGGPILLHDLDVVIGIPEGYARVNKVFDQSYAANYITTRTIIRHSRKALMDLGIQITQDVSGK